MRLAFAELPVHRFKDKVSDIQGILSLINQSCFVAAEVVKVEEVAPTDGDVIHEKLWRATNEK